MTSPQTSDPGTPENPRFRRMFAQRHVVLPVVHVTSEAQAVRNSDLARDAGADGVFLINHGPSAETLLAIHRAVARSHPGWWIGVNCLDLVPENVFDRLSPEVSGVWVDNAGIDETSPVQARAERIMEARIRSGWTGLYFGGVAFKHQRPVLDPAAAARTAARFMDVVTTSGPGTGFAASREKVSAMKSALGTVPLAIASGVTPANVSDYLPVVDCCLVASGISVSFDALDPHLTRALVQRVRAFSG
jgi:hypothetical protein